MNILFFFPEQGQISFRQGFLAVSRHSCILGGRCKSWNGYFPPFLDLTNTPDKFSSGFFSSFPPFSIFGAIPKTGKSHLG